MYQETPKDLLPIQKEYDGLNAKQKEAVDTVYGPVLVIAGPGTGKTQILALRIARLLQHEAQISPQNILCITYTDEGKKNMRDRLYRLIGAETAQYIQVHSYHSFCNDVIQQNLAYFKKDELDPISDLEKIEFIKEILNRLDSKSVLYNPKNPTKNAKYLLHLFSKMKQENWTSDYLRAKIEEHIVEVNTNPENLSKQGKTKGQLKAEFKKELESYKKTLEAIELFEAYRERMLNAHRYDFDDMIQWVIDLFENNDDILATYQERFQFILVDEFQDTNGSQMKIVELLTNHDDQPNIFAVGDDDQSIYRFQGASVENMLNFRRQYAEAGLHEICLKMNYRSPQSVLDHAKTLIEHAGSRLVKDNPDLDKDLVSYKTQQTAFDCTPRLLSFHNPRYEKIYLTQQIRALLDRGVPANEIAVLYYDNKNCLELSQYLHKANIPFYSKKNLDLLKERESRQIISIMRYIKLEQSHAYTGDELLFEILHYRFWHIPASDIAKASVAAGRRGDDEKPASFSLRFFLNELRKQHNPAILGSPAHPNLLKAIDTLEYLLSESFNCSLLVWMDTLLQRAGIIQDILASPNKLEELETVTALFDFLKDECHRRPDMRLGELVDFFDVMEENELEIPKIKIYGNEHAVRLFTVHASKGREFDYVFVAGAVSTQWEKRRTPPNSVKFPPNVFETATNSKDDDEMRRMMYVALTRAKKELTVSFYQYDLKQKDTEQSQFVYEVFGSRMEAEKIELSPEVIAHYETLIPSETPQAQVARLEKEYVDKQLQHFEMNVTALNNYLKCPLQFYYNSILRVPSAMNENMSFGDVIHKTLERIVNTLREAPHVAPSLEIAQQMFEQLMWRNREKFSQDKYEHLKRYGIDMIALFYQERLGTISSNVLTEHRISARLGEVPIKGFVDRIDVNDDKVHVVLVDYKTGDPTSDYNKKKLKTCNEDKEGVGGDYWRQAMFYKILFDCDATNKYIVQHAAYEFVEPNKDTKQLPEVHRFGFAPEHLEVVKTQIKTVWDKIQAHDFYEGCGDEKCSACQRAQHVNTAN